ncbi:MAG: nitrous oxide reductase accessory protein NosL [Syntrophorhabdaceae bacterium]|nr:nitrous oxide reductase accessory protein NosL [Syntrophorhabdaceae bacterium]
MNKKVKLLFLTGLLIVAFLLSGSPLFAQEDIQKYKTCGYCGMSREQFAFSRMLITYDDNTEVGVCSLHCAAVDLSLKLDKTPKSIQVGDYNTKKLIDAEKATWVIGGSKPGVMSKKAKWAFEKRENAEAFVKTNGGDIATFDQAMKTSYEDMYADTKMIRDKRKMRKMQMQEKR